MVFLYPIAGRFEVAAAFRQRRFHADAERSVESFVRRIAFQAHQRRNCATTSEANQYPNGQLIGLTNLPSGFMLEAPSSTLSVAEAGDEGECMWLRP